ncbi:hypothetical protein JW823_00700 [bacterium]|nr:hypothetical protein [candidate division CSSED10-310 bacterium]
MKAKSLWLIFFLFLTRLAFTSPAQAVLPPGAIDNARQSAQECLVIEITKVAATRYDLNGRQDIFYTAKVVKVERSANSIHAGDSITFKSYAIDPKMAAGIDGPVPPTLLAAGWTGRVWLNKGQDGLTIAVHGHSFQAMK